MKEKNEKILSRIEELLTDGHKFEQSVIFLQVGSPEFLEVQTWLNRAVLVIHSFLPTSHPFRRQSAAYMSGGGQLGVQGMMALLLSLKVEIGHGTFG